MTVEQAYTDAEIRRAERKAAERDLFILEVRESLRAWADRAVRLEPFQHGSFYGQLAHELLTVRAEQGDPLATERRVRRNQKVPRTIRTRVFRRDRYTCQECGFRMPEDPQQRLKHNRDGVYLTIDHVLPLAEGGANRAFNMRTLCNRCNNRKGHQLPESAGPS